MKVSARAILPFAAWIAAEAAVIRSAPDGTPLSESARAVVRAAGPSATCEWFTQPIDHKNASNNKSWQQIYCVDPQWWTPGAPVVLMTPGGEPITWAVNSARGFSYLKNTTLAGRYAQELGAAAVVVEHRYFGGSSPYDGFDAETLQYLTLEQAAADLVNFAQNVTFPFDKEQTSVASKVPWVYWGSSYSATLGSWIEHLHPGVFHAYHLSSATVQANTENWYYYDTIRKGIDALRNDTRCSAALEEVVDFVDRFLLASPVNETETDALKQYFGAVFPIANDDFAYAIATPFRYWEERGGYRAVLDMCDGIVGSDATEEHEVLGTIPSSVGNYAAYFQTNFRDSTCTYLDVWGQKDPLWCLDTHDPLNPFIEARTLGNPWRTRIWFRCNEPLASWATGAPRDRPSVVSRRVDAAYWQAQCETHFPAVGGHKYGSADGVRTPDTLNAVAGGWARQSRRVIWTVGEFDPWRATSMASELRPGGPLESSGDVYVFVIKNAEHADDALTEAGLANLNLPVNPEVVKAQQQSVGIVKEWVGQFRPGGDEEGSDE
ncbi:serine carboxypeptidase S28-domain-containing protein [Thermothelomyces heterothallicus CBS 202.75]|uniref:serine carboxypeptidase S28-domain-containing protein n=1 Tax=Thermothelomyces heterothallicus CBS 202.75 TaxID=1149848 RepID=UPI003742B437